MVYPYNGHPAWTSWCAWYECEGSTQSDSGRRHLRRGDSSLASSVLPTHRRHRGLPVGAMPGGTAELVVPSRGVSCGIPPGLDGCRHVRAADRAVRGQCRSGGRPVPQSHGRRRQPATISVHQGHHNRHQRCIDVHCTRLFRVEILRIYTDPITQNYS